MSEGALKYSAHSLEPSTAERVTLCLCSLRCEISCQEIKSVNIKKFFSCLPFFWDFFPFILSFLLFFFTVSLSWYSFSPSPYSILKALSLSKKNAESMKGDWRRKTPPPPSCDMYQFSTFTAGLTSEGYTKIGGFLEENRQVYVNLKHSK